MAKHSKARKSAARNQADAKLAILAAASDIPQTELKRRVLEARNQAERDEAAKRAEQREQSIRFNVKHIEECLTDAEELARALMRGKHELPPETLAHGIVAVAGRGAEFLNDLRRDLNITAPDA